MAIRFHAILARKHGSPQAYIVPGAISFGSESPVLEKFREILDPAKGADFRRDHAEVIVLRDLIITDQLDFPDPAIAEAERKRKALADALKANTDAEAARDNFRRAKEAAALSQQALKDLTPEQIQLVNEYKAARARATQTAAEVEKARQAAASAAEAARIEGESKRIAAAGSSDSTAAGANLREALYESAKAGLEKVSDADLNLAAANYKVEIEGMDRAAAIDAILTASGHKPAAPAQEPPSDPPKSEIPPV